MNDDLIKPDSNKPVVPDMDSDIPSITPENIDSKAPLADTLDTPQAPESIESPTSQTTMEAKVEPSSPVPPAPILPPAPAEPLLPAETHAPVPPKESRIRKPLMVMIAVVLAIMVLAAAAFATYKIGNSRGYKNGKSDQAAATAMTALKIPQNATMVAQCAVGEGTQYVLPSNIPEGPIYNVWNNKVTGIEYMLAQSNIANNKTLDLALHGQKYDHIDVMYEAAGHAGFSEPHYHIVLSMISYADEQKITCSSGSSSSHNMSSMDM